MYKFDDGQISIHEFGQPAGMKLKEDKRWVKKAQMIPWGEIEKKYAKLFTNHKGNVAKPLRLGLGACIIQSEYGFSDEEVTQMIQEHPYFQYFCGYKEYDDSKPPFDSSLMVYFRKRLTPEILGEINEMIISEAQPQKAQEPEDDKNDDNSHPGNGGTMIVDATCAPSDIRYPQDTSLLNEARKSAEKLIDALHTRGEDKPRTYRQEAYREYLKFARKRKRSASFVRKAIKKQLGYLSRDLGYINVMLANGKTLSEKQSERLNTIHKLYEQQKFMYDNHTHRVDDRIVSLSQPFLRPIVRGKAGKPGEFGAKLDISVVDGLARLEVFSFDAYNESSNLKDMVERYLKRTGRYLSRILADKIYRNRDNLDYCRLHGIRLSGPALGRPKKNEERDKKQDYKDECERVEV